MFAMLCFYLFIVIWSLINILCIEQKMDIYSNKPCLIKGLVLIFFSKTVLLLPWIETLFCSPKESWKWESNGRVLIFLLSELKLAVCCWKSGLCTKPRLEGYCLYWWNSWATWSWRNFGCCFSTNTSYCRLPRSTSHTCLWKFLGKACLMFFSSTSLYSCLEMWYL